MLLEMDLAAGLFFYLGFWLITVVILWARELWRLHRSDELKMSRGRLFSCDNCQYVFLHEEPENLTRCPRCNAVCILRKKPH